MDQPQLMTMANTATDDSGLHDLKALATSTKRRRSQRLSSQIEAQDSLLQSGASLEAVALPDPTKEQAISLSAVTIGEAPAALASVANESTTTPSFSSVGTPPASISKYLFAGVAVAAAAAAAFYVMRGGASDSGDSTSSAANALVVSADEQDQALPEPAEPAPIEVAPLALVDDTESDSSDPSADDQEDATENNVAATPEAGADAEDLKATTDAKTAEKKSKLSESEREAARAAAKEKRERAKASRAERRAAKALGGYL